MRYRIRQSDFLRLVDFVFLGRGGDDPPVLTSEQWQSDVPERVRLIRALLDAFDPASIAVRLHIANKDLWDQYDRFVAEAELRLTLAPSVLLIAVAVAPMAWWLTPIVAVVSWGLAVSGEYRSHHANGVLITCLITKVINDPQVDLLRLKPTDSDTIPLPETRTPQG
jgi:hypothetical protein